MPDKGAKSKKNIVARQKDIFSYILPIVFSVLAVSFTISKISNEDDIFWHLTSGKYIVENKIIPDSDVFSYSTLGQQWIPFEWGWDVLNYLLYSSTGFLGISILNSLVFYIFFILIFLTSRRFEVSFTLIFLVLLVFLFGIFERILPRPQAFSYLFFVFLISIILRYKYFGHQNIRSFYFSPLLFLVWANIHMGVLVGIIIFALFLTTEYISYFKTQSRITAFAKSSDIKLLKILTLVFIFSFVALLLNPHGFETYSYVYSHLTMKHIGAVNEWISPFNSRFSSQFYVIIYYLFLISGVLILFYCFRKKDLFGILIFLIFAINSVRAIRYTVDFLVITIIYYILSINYIISIQNNTKFKNLFSISVMPKVIIAAVCIVFIIFLPGDKLYHNFLKYPRFVGTGLDSTFFPIKLFSFIKENKIQDIGEKPFNSYECGGFFLWSFPGKKDFIDSRAVNESIMNDFNMIFSKLPAFEKKIKAYDFDYAICTEKDMVPAPQFMQEFIISYFFTKADEWKLVYWDDKSLLFLRDVPKFKNIISQYEYKYINPYNFVYRKNLIEIGIKENKNKVIMEMNRNFELEPNGYYINYISKIYGNKLK